VCRHGFFWRDFSVAILLVPAYNNKEL